MKYLPVHRRILVTSERYFRRYTTVVSVSAGSGVGSPYISHECPADSLRFAAIHFPIASCASFMVVRAAVDGDGNLAPLRFGRVHLARSFKCARDLDAEVTRYRRAGLLRVVIEKNVVAVAPQPRLTANELPDLAQRRPPRRADLARRDLTPHRRQLTGVNSLYRDGDLHSKIVDQSGERGCSNVR